MATQNFSTTIETKVPACEIAATINEVNQALWFTCDMLKVMQSNIGQEISDAGTSDISPMGFEYFIDTCLTMMSKQTELISTLEVYLNFSNVETGGSTIRNICHVPTGNEPISQLYKQQLKGAAS